MQLDKFDVGDIQLLSATIRPQSTVRDSGVIPDSQLTMVDQVSSLRRSGYYQQWQLRTVARGH